ncbi:MAG: TlpA disulfide reductase family protein [Candidatus Sumerlaeia bacterium]|nr:TlpA disulfide reductase family protein [Candidatus Sumerlaeia bacterium]
MMRTRNVFASLALVLLTAGCNQDSTPIAESRSTVADSQPTSPASPLVLPKVAPLGPVEQRIAFLKGKLQGGTAWRVSGEYAALEVGVPGDAESFQLFVSSPDRFSATTKLATLTTNGDRGMLLMHPEQAHVILPARRAATPSLAVSGVPIGQGLFPFAAAFDWLTHPELLDSATANGDALQFTTLFGESVQARFAESGEVATFTVQMPLGEIVVAVKDFAPLKETGVFELKPPADSQDVSQQFIQFTGAEPSKELVGQPASDFTLRMLSGEAVQLSSLKGNVVLLDFWATWCPPCVAALPKLEKLHHSLQNEPVQILAINLNQAEDLDSVVPALLKKQGVEKLPVLHDDSDTLVRDYRIDALPHVVIIDAEGIIREVHIGREFTLEELRGTLLSYVPKGE